jgi:hypothetical protein
MRRLADAHQLRLRFIAGLFLGLRVAWPILSGLLITMIVLGLAIGRLEGWHVYDAIYFSFVTGLTIGYGDLVPTTLVGRALAIVIGLCGILTTGLVAAIAVKAFTAMNDDERS